MEVKSSETERPKNKREVKDVTWTRERREGERAFFPAPVTVDWTVKLNLCDCCF